MRDKVKRFISILMTALMLVNLMPVGALAEGMKLDSNSVQSIWWWPWPEETWPEGSYKIYVYAKVLKGSVGGINVNKDGWYTLGYIDAQTMPSPIGTLGNLYGGGNAQGYDLGSLNAQSLIQSSAFHFEKNTNIPVRNTPIWSTDGAHGFKACSGATDYPETGNAPTWHLDILVNLKDVTPIHRLVFKVENSSGTQIGSKAIEGTWGQEITYEKGKDVPETITTKDGKIYELKRKNDNLGKTFKFDEVTKQIEFYYKYKGSVNHTLTINYVYEDGSEAAKSYQKTLPYQSYYSVTSPDITGYTADNPVVSGTMPADNVEVTVTYTKRTDLSYTVNYLEKDTNKVLHDAKTVENQTFEAVVNPADEKIAIDGYNYVGADKEKLTIGTGENVLNLYYTKRTDLSYTVNYYWNGTTDEVAESKTVRDQTFDDEVTEFPEKDIPGCTPVSNDSKTIKIGTGTNEINFYYYKNVELEANSATLSYNGKAQSVSGFTGAPEDADFSAITVDATGTDAETYPAEFAKGTVGTVDVTEKYIVTAANNGQLVITPRSVTLTSAPASKVYDGNALTNDTVTVSGDGFAKDEGAAYDVTGSRTDVGESDNTFTYTLNEGTKATNYNIELAFGKLEVTPVTAEVIVTITGRTDETTYDGKPHFVFGFDAEPSNKLYNPNKDMQFNGFDEDMIAEGTDAGQYNIGLTAEDFTNKSKNFSKVTFVVTDGYVKITPRAVTLTSETAGKTYDGTALEKPVVTVGGDGFVEGQVKEIKATGSVTNAGSVANTITFTPNKETFKEGNYAITKNEGTLTINKRSVLITSQSATKTYDGSALTRPAVTITGDGFVPGELSKAEATGSITNVGSTPNAIQYTTTGAFNAANYSIALSVGTLTVTEKPKPEPRRTFNLTINYVYQNGKRAAASYNRGGLKNGETFDITSPVIAGYTASETVVSGTIYNRDVKVTVIYTADGVNLDDYGVPLGLGNITMNVGDCFE